jgi:hypothetical protein
MRIGLAVLATVAAAIALPPTAHADSDQFQSPSGNIACDIGTGGVACDIRDYTYQPPPPPPCAQHFPWGSRFVLEPGKAATIVCHSDTLRVPGEPTLPFGQTKTVGTFTCDSEPLGMKCADTSTDNYFRVSRDSYDLG